MSAPSIHPTQAPTPLQDHDCEIIENRDCGRGLKILRLRGRERFVCQPGQFVMLDLPDPKFYFRRPFSVLDVHENGDFDIYYKIVGQGTRLMADWQPGGRSRCLGPLGNRFTPPQAPEAALYIGGGIGIAPLYLMGKTLGGGGHCFYGVRGREEIGLETDLKTVFGNQLLISTDDGSAGLRGNVCDLLVRHRDTVLAAREAYICGPTPMMAAADRLLREMNPGLRIEVSLEEHMPCGTGACTGCVVPRADRPLPSKVCVEGPVFDARAIRWNGWSAPAAAAGNAICEESPCPL